MTDPKDLGFVAPAPMGDAEPADIFDQLLEGTTDDERAVEPTDDDLGTLEEEWHRLCVMREASDAAEERAKETRAAYVAQRERMMSAMRRQGTKQFRGANGQACSIAEIYTTSLEDEAKFMGWVKETHPELLTVHSKSRTKFIREQYRDRGVAIDDPSFPPGLKVGTVDNLTVRGIRPAAETQGAETNE